jgi:hypothetical protein
MISMTKQAAKDDLCDQLARYKRIRDNSKDAWLIGAMTALIDDAEDMLGTLNRGTTQWPLLP